MSVKSTKGIGDQGESLAVKFLLSIGYEIIERNWRTRFGEIDIIAEKDGVLVFVEVKSKTNDRYGSPGEMINRRKLEKLKKVALSYLKENKHDGPWRIDAVTVSQNIPKLIENITI